MAFDGKVIIQTLLDTKKAQRSAQGLGNKLKSGLATGAKVTGKALGVVTSTATTTAGAMVKATKATMEYGVEVNRNSQKLNMSKKGYQEWSYVLKRSGTSIDSLRMGMKKISTQIDEAKNGSASATENFKRLGLSVDDLKGKSQEEIFGLMVQRLQGIKDTTERSAIANKFFGRSAQEMAGLLNKSGKDVEALKKQAHDLGLVMSDSAIKASADFRGKLTELQSAFEGLRNKMAVQFLPALTQVTDGLSLIVQGDTDKGFKKIEKGIEGFSNKLLQMIPRVLQLGGSIVKSLATSIINNLPTLVSTGTQIALTLINGFISMLPTAITMIIQSIQTLLSSLSAQLPTLLTTLVNGIINALLLLLQNVPNLIQVAITFINSLVSAILQAIPVLIERLPEIITSVIQALISSLPLIVSGLIELVANIVTKIPEIILGILEAIPDMISSFFDMFTDEKNIEKMITGFIEAQKKILESSGKIIKVITDDIPNMIKKFFKKLKEKIPEIVEKLKAFIKDVWDHRDEIFANIKQWFKDLPDKIEEWTKDLPEKAKDFGRTFGSKLIAGIKAYIIAKGNIAEKIWGYLKDGKILELRAKMENLGWEMLKGLFKGLMKIKTTEIKMVVNFKLGVLDAIKKAFGIKSPSKVMRDEIGYWMGAGVSEGLVDGFMKQNPMSQINNAMASEIQSSAGKLQSAINASINLNNNIQGLAGAVVEGIANSNLTVKIGDREMGRVVRSY